jgi:hypothetical protein
MRYINGCRNGVGNHSNIYILALTKEKHSSNCYVCVPHLIKEENEVKRS